MYSNITQKNNRQHAGSFLMTVILLAFINIVTFAQPYINGPLSTGPLSGATTAPAGFTWSELQGTNTGLGSGANIGAGFTLADDFVVPIGQTWNLTKVTFYAYSTGFTGAASPFNDTRVQIFNTNPSTGAPVPVFGNLTTNRFAASSTASIYRTALGGANTTRQIWKIEATVVTSLSAGTYWIEWQHGTIAPGGSNFSPAKTVVGQATQPGNNAIQHTLTGNTWAAITDVGGPQDFPFLIDYVPTGAPCTAVSPGATILAPTSVCPNIPFNLSVTTPGTGIGILNQWQRSTDNITYTDIAGANGPTLSTSQTVATWYRLRVTCGANAPLFSTPVQAMMSTSCYCVPTTLNCAFSDFIARVNFAGINNPSACTTGGYINYTTSVAAGTPFVGASNPIAVTVGPGGIEHVGVWIDYNQNGTFETTEFTYLGSANGATINSSIAIPTTALLGPTRMRVRVQWNTAVNAGNSCAQTSGFGEVEDYTVNIIPCNTVAITTQPANASAVCGSTATFTTAATGSIPAYTWQFRTSPTSAWQPVMNNATYSNATTASLTVATSTALNGYEYRALVSGACSGFNNTNIATLTVNQLLAVVTPTAQSICAGSNAIVPISIGNTSGTATTTFSSAANLALAIPENGTGVTNVINIATLPASSQITDVKVRFNITHTWGGDLIMALKAPNGQVYNLSYALNGTDNGPGAFTNTVVSLNPLSPLGAAYPLLSAGTAPFTNTYKADGRTAATATPLDNGVNTAIRPTGPTGFTATTSIPADIYGLVGSGNGAWTFALYDFYDDGPNGGNINRLVNWSLDLTYGSLASGIYTSTPATPNTIFTDAAATVAYTGTPINTVYVKPTATTSYNVAINTGLCTTSANVLVTVNAGPTGTLAVAPVAVCVGKNAVFSYTGLTGGTGLTHQWQVSTTAVPTFTNIAGATSASYTTAAVTAAMSGNKYRVIVGSMGCSVASSLTSSDATLTVNPNPVVTISAAPITKLFPGLTSTLTASVTPNAVGATYQWTRNGANVAGATANKYVVNIDGLGSYTVKAVDVNGCTTAATIPASISISDSANKETLFIYPSPNTGKFQVRYYNDISDTRNAPGAVNIYDEKGSRVFTRTYSPGLGYGSMQVDLGTHGSGVYRVDLINPKGERIKTGSVMVF